MPYFSLLRKSSKLQPLSFFRSWAYSVWLNCIFSENPAFLTASWYGSENAGTAFPRLGGHRSVLTTRSGTCSFRGTAAPRCSSPVPPRPGLQLRAKYLLVTASVPNKFPLAVENNSFQSSPKIKHPAIPTWCLCEFRSVLTPTRQQY